MNDRRGTRRSRIALIGLLLVAVLAVLWFVVFPWLDRTFVNRPQLERGAPAAAAYRAPG